MSLFVDCIEPHGRPQRRTIEVSGGEEFALYVLPPGDARAGLRRTVMRRQDGTPPSGSRLVMWMRYDGSDVTVVEVNRGVLLEMLRSDLRTQVVSGMRMATSTSFELTLSDRSQVSFTLALRQPLAQGAAQGAAGGGTRTSRVMYTATNVFWLITDSNGIIVTFWIKIRDSVVDRFVKMGIDSRVLSFAWGLLAAGAIGAYVAWQQHGKAVSEGERADAAEEAATLAQAAREASLATELSCLDERKRLAARLGEVAVRQSLAAQEALELDLARSVSLELGGVAMSDEALGKTDALYLDPLLATVVSRLDASKGDPAPCLDYTAALGSDTPRFVLLWNLDEALTCPDDYTAVDEGVEHVGRWGLSERVAREFGHGGNSGTGTDASAIGKLLGDPRLEDRWAAFTVTTAFREVQATILRARTGRRPPVLPGQAQLWALAFLDAYNRLPSPADGVLDGTAADCVSAVIADHLADAPPAVPGQAVLPDLVSVATEEDVLLVARPTPACPWPKDAMRRGAGSALQAAARLATLGLSEEE